MGGGSVCLEGSEVLDVGRSSYVSNFVCLHAKSAHAEIVLGK